MVQVITDRTKRQWSAYGESLPDVVQWLRQTPRTWRTRTSEAMNGSYGSRDWALGHDWQKILQLAERGWEEGVANIAELGLAAPRNAHVGKMVMDVAGYEPDVGRYLGGDPNCMRHKSRRADTSKMPTLSLVYSISAHAGTDAKDLALMGAAMVAVIDKLETAGRRVELSACMSGQDCGGWREMAVGWRVKEAQDHVDLNAVAFSIAHPGAMRRICFAMIERSPMGDDPGYSMPHQLKRDLWPQVADAYYIPGLVNYWTTRPTNLKQAIRLLADQINEAVGEDIVELDQ